MRRIQIVLAAVLLLLTALWLAADSAARRFSGKPCVRIFALRVCRQTASIRSCFRCVEARRLWPSMKNS